jgi:hypothetical protein
MKRKIVVLLFACLPLLASTAFAQYRARLFGTVTDSTGAVVPNAQVTLTDDETHRQLNATTGPDGTYSFNQLAPSSYTLDVKSTGFQPRKLEHIVIRAEQANNIDVMLTPGAESQTVTVTANAAPPIDTGTGQISGAVNQEQISKLPAFGRDVYQLAQLAPGVFGSGAQQASGSGTFNLPGNQGPGGSGGGNVGGIFQTENRPQVSAAGQRPDQNNITLDGASISSVTWAGAAVVTPTADSVKELKVVSNNYDAEFGRNSGAQIETISQNGTNNFHGSAFIKIDRPGLNAFPRWDPAGTPGISKNPSKCKDPGLNCVNDRNNGRFNQIGGSVGGPIWKNKIFFFFAYETARNASTGFATGWFETPSLYAAAPAGSISSKFLGVKGIAPSNVTILEGAGTGQHDCASIGLVQGQNCNWIVGQGLDIGSPLTGVPLGTTDPSFNASTHSPGVGNGLDGVPDIYFVQTSSPDRQVAQQFNGRLDFQATQKDLLAYSIYHVPLTHEFFNGPFRASNFFHHNQTNYTQTFLWNHIFSASLLNEIRADAAGWKWNEFTSNPQTPYGLPQAHITTTSSGTSIGSIEPQYFGASFGSIFNQNTYAVRDNLSKVMGSHSLKFGGEYTKLEYLDDPTWNAQPSYFFNNYWDFLNDAPSSETVTVDPRTGIPSDFRKDTRQNLWAFYGKDDWKVKPNLTVNLGLRWEYFGGLYEKKGNLSTLLLGSGANLLSGARFVLGGNQVNPPKGNFGPQIGFAWSPANIGSKLVFRGGFGMGYSALEAAILTNVRFNPPFVTNSGTLTDGKIVYGIAQDVYKFGQFPANPNLITGFDANNMPTASGVSLSATGIPRDLPTQYTYRYSLQVEREIGEQWVGSIGYQGSLGRHLPLQTNLNALFAPQVLAGQMTYNPRLNFVDWFYDGGNSSFNALLGELRHRFARTFEFDAQYRWAKSIDEGSGPFTTSYYIFGPAKLNRGPSDFDVRHYLKLWALWEPHIFPSRNSWLEKVFGDWTISGIYNFHTGFPWSPVYGGLGCNAVIQNTGQCDLLPGAYLGGAGMGQATDTFKQDNGNFPGGGKTYFTQPSVTNSPGGAWPVAPVGPLPGLPGIGRNTFYGPRYSDVDATLTKGFGLPHMPVLGESARLEIRANAYNLFNKLNLVTPVTNINDGHFGRAGAVLAGRTVEMEAHFRF